MSGRSGGRGQKSVSIVPEASSASSLTSYPLNQFDKEPKQDLSKPLSAY